MIECIWLTICISIELVFLFSLIKHKNTFLDLYFEIEVS